MNDVEDIKREPWGDHPIVNVLDRCKTCTQHSMLAQCVVDVRGSLKRIECRLSKIEAQHISDQAGDAVLDELKSKGWSIAIGLFLLVAGGLIGMVLR